MKIDIKALPLEQKKLLLAILEHQIGRKLTDTDAKEDPFLAESRKCNEIAKLKKQGKSIIYTELQ